MALTYTLAANITPQSASRGERIKLTAKFSDASEPVVKAYGTIRMYGWFVPLTKDSDGLFTYSGTVPYEAPSGKFDIAVYGKAADGSNGPETKVSITVQ